LAASTAALCLAHGLGTAPSLQAASDLLSGEGFEVDDPAGVGITARALLPKGGADADAGRRILAIDYGLLTDPWLAYERALATDPALPGKDGDSLRLDLLCSIDHLGQACLEAGRMLERGEGCAQADPGAARHYYQRAMLTGAPGAEALLRRLGDDPA
nr:hypothetical protein [Succinivibrionaceae bacterium]